MPQLAQAFAAAWFLAAAPALSLAQRSDSLALALRQSRLDANQPAQILRETRQIDLRAEDELRIARDRKSTRLNSSHG